MKSINEESPPPNQLASDFLESLSKISTMNEFPDRMIVRQYKYSYLFEFETLFSEEFFSTLKKQIKNELEYFILLVIEPDPFTYFDKHFNCLPLIQIDKRTSFENYIYSLNADPGDSPADSIISNSRIVYVADNNFEKIFIVLRDKEIGIGYFINNDVMNQMKTDQHYGIIDPQDEETIPRFLLPIVKKYQKKHNVI